jgi:hypothetical protein
MEGAKSKLDSSTSKSASGSKESSRSAAAGR